MEEQPSFEPSPDAARRAQVGAFVRSVGRILGVSLVGSVLYALVVGPRRLTGVADGMFIAGALWLIIALVPLFGEIFGRANMSFRMAEQTFDEALDEEKTRTQQGETMTYVFGTSGIIVVALSFILSGLA